jgi:hypothetical protein
MFSLRAMGCVGVLKHRLGKEIKAARLYQVSNTEDDDEHECFRALFRFRRPLVRLDLCDKHIDMVLLSAGQVG